MTGKRLLDFSHDKLLADCVTPHLGATPSARRRRRSHIAAARWSFLHGARLRNLLHPDIITKDDYLLVHENGAQQQMNDGLCLQEDLAAWGTDVPGQIHCSNVDCPPNWSSGVSEFSPWSFYCQDIASEVRPRSGSLTSWHEDAAAFCDAAPVAISTPDVGSSSTTLITEPRKVGASAECRKSTTKVAQVTPLSVEMCSCPSCPMIRTVAASAESRMSTPNSVLGQIHCGHVACASVRDSGACENFSVSADCFVIASDVGPRSGSLTREFWQADAAVDNDGFDFLPCSVVDCHDIASEVRPRSGSMTSWHVGAPTDYEGCVLSPCSDVALVALSTPDAESSSTTLATEVRKVGASTECRKSTSQACEKDCRACKSCLDIAPEVWPRSGSLTDIAPEIRPHSGSLTREFWQSDAAAAHEGFDFLPCSFVVPAIIPIPDVGSSSSTLAMEFRKVGASAECRKSTLNVVQGHVRCSDLASLCFGVPVFFCAWFCTRRCECREKYLWLCLPACEGRFAEQRGWQ